MSANTKNYAEQGGAAWHIGGKLIIEDGAEVTGLLTTPAQNVEPVASASTANNKAAINAMLIAMKNAGIMIPDSWNVSVLACPTPAAMPTEETAANSGHATLAIDDTAITITLDCKVEDLADSDHGSTWGEHKWLGFGVRTGLDSVVGVKFTDDTGAEATLTGDDASEATTLGLSAGDFVLYIKAEDEKYLTGKKSFTLWIDGYAATKFTMQIIESTDPET